MPDPVLILQALAAAVVTFAMVFLLGALGRKRHPAWTAIGSVLGVGLGFYAGCAWLGVRPHWPPREDQDRLLFVLFPAAVVVELIATAIGRWSWLPRLAIAAGAAWVLLYDSTYITDLAGPGSREWTPEQTWLILSALAAALVAVWAVLCLLARRTGGRTVPLTLALVNVAAALTVMLSGYASGGLLGLPLAAAVAGVLVASLVSGPFDSTGAVSLGLIGLFALLVIGRFFGQLTTTHAIVLFLAPLLCSLTELPYVRRLDCRVCNLARLVMVAVPLVLVLKQAEQKFLADSKPPSTESQEGSIDDYMNFGK